MANNSGIGAIIRNFIKVYVIQWVIRKVLNRR